jgi:hypothetical protein
VRKSYPPLRFKEELEDVCRTHVTRSPLGIWNFAQLYYRTAKINHPFQINEMLTLYTCLNLELGILPKGASATRGK